MTSAEALGFARQGYEGAASAWADGAELVYGPLADALLARAPALAGRVVLDVGAGTGAVSRRLVTAGSGGGPERTGRCSRSDVPRSRSFGAVPGCCNPFSYYRGR